MSHWCRRFGAFVHGAKERCRFCRYERERDV